MSGLDELQLSVVQHLNGAKRAQALLDLMRYAAKQLALMGVPHSTEFSGAGEFILCCSTDVSAWSPIAKGKAVHCLSDAYGPGPVVPILKALDDAADIPSVGPGIVPNVPKLERLAVPASPPELVTGKWSAAEVEILVQMTVEGEKPLAISKVLRRATNAVNQKKYALSDTIDKALAAKSPPSPPSIEGRSASKEPAAPRPDRDVSGPTPDTPSRWGKKLKDLDYPSGWTPELDLKFVQHIRQGAGVAGAGALLKIKSDAARARWREISGGNSILADQLLSALIIALTDRVALISQSRKA